MLRFELAAFGEECRGVVVPILLKQVPLSSLSTLGVGCRFNVKFDGAARFSR